jgi:hypothetical protein
MQRSALCRRSIEMALLLAIAMGAQPVAAAADAVGSLTVESEPAGASVYVDGRFTGQTQQTITASFTGALNGGSISGSLTVNDRVDFPTGATRDGTVVIPISLRFKD